VNPKDKMAARMRDARGDLDYRGRKSFYLTVDMAKNPGRSHGWKKHFKHRTCAYELAGLLESLCERFNRPDRFIFASMDYLRKNCFKGDRADRKNFSEREFFYTVRLFRKLGIISPAMWRDGHEGIIAAPHSALCVHDGKDCRFIGPTFFNRRKQGFTGRFSMTPEGWLWHADETIPDAES
jgi:hypothetical protein